jgi:hypothetical protein
MSAAKKVKLDKKVVTEVIENASTTTALCLVELVNPNRDKSNLSGSYFRIPDETLNFLSTIKRNIVIVSVCGSFRIGKSSLANMAILELEPGQTAFKTGSSTNRVTQGIWISKYTRDIKIDGQDCTIIAMDSEGLGSIEASGNDYDLKVFALTFLFSDLFLYNHKNAIDEPSIEKLGLVLDITKKIKATAATVSDSKMKLDVPSTEAATEEEHQRALNELEELSAYFPAFIWVIRDCELSPTDETGKTISWTQYLEKCWRPTGHKARDRIRDGLRIACERRDCVAIGTPTLDDKWKKFVDIMPEKEMSRGFRDGVFDLKQKIKQYAKPKQLRGTPIDGNGFAELAKAFVAAINQKDTVPVMDDICTSFAKQQIRQQYEKIVAEFHSNMKDIQSKQTASRRRKVPAAVSATSVASAIPYFLKPHDFHTTLEGYRTEAIEKLHKNCMSTEDLLEEFIVKLNAEIDQTIEQLVSNNLANMSQWISSEIANVEKFILQQPSPEFPVLLEEFQRVYRGIVLRCGESESLDSIFWVEQQVGEKVWKWMESILKHKLAALQEQVLKLENDHSALDAAQARYTELLTENESTKQQMFDLQQAGEQMKQEWMNKESKWNESYTQLQQQYQIDVVQNQFNLQSCLENREKLKADLLLQLDQHSANLLQKEKLLNEQTLQMQELKNQIEQLTEHVELHKTQNQHLNEDVEAIEVWRNENADLKEQILNLQTELEGYKSRSSQIEIDFQSQLEEVQQEAFETIESNLRVFENEKRVLLEQNELMKVEMEKAKQLQQQDLKNLQEVKTQCSQQVARVNEDLRRSELQQKQTKQELTQLNQMFYEKTKEYTQSLEQLYLKLQEKTQQMNEQKSEATRQQFETEMQLTTEIKNLESKALLLEGKYEEVVKYYSNHPDLKAIKALREDHLNISNKLASLEAQVKLLQIENTEKRKVANELQSQNNALLQKIATMTATHAFEMRKEELKSARVKV